MKDDIIAMSPVIKEPGVLPHRIVIRDLRDVYVVHMQANEEGKEPWYHGGNYFYKSSAAASVAEPDEKAIAKAWACFERRVRRTMHLEEVGVL